MFLVEIPAPVLHAISEVIVNVVPNVIVAFPIISMSLLVVLVALGILVVRKSTHSK